MNSPGARSAVIGKAIEWTLDRNLDAVCFDNCYWGYAPGVGNPYDKDEWTDAFMKFYSTARDATDANGLKLIVNVAAANESIKTEGWPEIAPYVDGLISEIPLHPSYRKKSEIDAVLDVFEDVVDDGKMVILFTSKITYSEDDTYTNRDLLKAFTVGKVRPLAETYGNIYVVRHGVVLTSKGKISDTLACLDNFGTNLISNGTFDDWLSSDPCNWTITGESGTNPEISELGYIDQVVDSNNVNFPYVQAQLHNPTSPDAGVCNLYTSGTSNISISQYLTTVFGETYRVYLYIGQDPIDADNTDLVGSVTVSDNGGGAFSKTYSTCGPQWFDFTATSSTTTFKIENANAEETDISFDDIAVWKIDE
jgi:hypothetical protein